MFAVLHSSAIRALYIRLSTPLLSPCVKGAGYKTSILAVLYYGETYSVYAAAACRKYEFDGSGKQIDDMEERV